jgi:hypothetical protein
MSDPPSDENTGGLPADLDSTVDRRTDLDELRDGGPTRTPGVMTTTGGTAGPASVRRQVLPGAGPTTTGDAGSGGMDAPIDGAISDATTAGSGGAAVSGRDGASESRQEENRQQEDRH